MAGVLVLACAAWPAQAQVGDGPAQCRAVAGAPTAAAPVSREAATSYFSTLAKARIHCEAAVIGSDPDPEALFHLAVIMQREGEHDYALRIFNQAAEAGIAAAHTKIGDYFNFGIGGVRQNSQRAVSAYEAAAEAGDAPAKATLAIMYQIGRGVPQDFDRMLALLTEAAEAGYHFAQLRLAELFMSPDAVPAEMAERLDLPNPIKASEFYELAATQGNAKARVEVEKIANGEGIFDDPAVRLKLIRRGVERGEGQALNALGFMLERGDGVDYDPARAAQLYIRALESGDISANDLRGLVNGRATRWDRETALEFQIILQERGLYLGFLDAAIGPGTLAAAQRVANGE